MQGTVWPSSSHTTGGNRSGTHGTFNLQVMTEIEGKLFMDENEEQEEQEESCERIGDWRISDRKFSRAERPFV